MSIAFTDVRDNGDKGGKGKGKGKVGGGGGGQGGAAGVRREGERAAGGNAERADDAAVGLEFTRLCARLAALAARLAPVSAR